MPLAGHSSNHGPWAGEVRFDVVDEQTRFTRQELHGGDQIVGFHRLGCQSGKTRISRPAATSAVQKKFGIAAMPAPAIASVRTTPKQFAWEPAGTMSGASVSSPRVSVSELIAR